MASGEEGASAFASAAHERKGALKHATWPFKPKRARAVKEKEPIPTNTVKAAMKCGGKHASKPPEKHCCSGGFFHISTPQRCIFKASEANRYAGHVHLWCSTP